MLYTKEGKRVTLLINLICLLLSMLLVACGAAQPAQQGAAPAEEKPAEQAPAQEEPAKEAAAFPDYYPPNYNEMVEASKNESEGLLIYSIMSETNWAPVVEGFNAKYPWIKVSTADLGAYEVFERFYTESAGNARTG